MTNTFLCALLRQIKAVVPVAKTGFMLALVFLLVSANLNQAFACACGCGVFDIGGLGFAPSNSDSGLSTWFRYDSMNQNTNFEGQSKAAATDNTDKKITTQFYTVGAQYMITHDFGVMAELPFYQRSFTTDYTGMGNVSTFNLNAVGDARLMGMYSGFSPDHSTGVVFGLKLPTGRITSPYYNTSASGYIQVYDPDTMPGSGSTDLLLGGFHVGQLTSDGKLSYFLQGLADLPFAYKNGYRPGAEFDGAVGVTYDFGSYGALTKIAPIAQVIGSYRLHDSYAVNSVDSISTGLVGQNPNSGYTRLFLSPGLDLRVGKFKIYADVEFAVWQKVNHSNFATTGNAGQLVSPQLYKLQVGYDF